MGEQKITLDNYVRKNKNHLLKSYTLYIIAFLYLILVYNVYKHNLSFSNNTIDNLLIWIGIAFVIGLLYPIILYFCNNYLNKHYIIIGKNKIIFKLGLKDKKIFPANKIDIFTLEPSYIRIVKKDGLVFKARYHLTFSSKETLKEWIKSFNTRNNIRQV